MTEQNQIRAYLLGVLDPERAEDFDTRLFLDDEFLASVREQRELLTDDFLSGSLSAEEDTRFREQCRLSSDLRDDVQARRTLQRALERHRSAPVSPPQKTLLPQRRPRWRIFGLPLLAGGVCALLLTVQLARHQRTPPSQTASAPQAAPVQPVPVPVPQVEPETFFLAAAVTRGVTQRPEIRVSPQTVRINLQIEIRHDLANVPLWRAELSGAGHAASLAGCEKPQRVGSQVFLACALSLESLPDGLYLIRMSPNQAETPAATREFVLTRKLLPREHTSHDGGK